MAYYPMYNLQNKYGIVQVDTKKTDIIPFHSIHKFIIALSQFTYHNIHYCNIHTGSQYFHEARERNYLLQAMTGPTLVCHLPS